MFLYRVVLLARFANHGFLVADFVVALFVVVASFVVACMSAGNFLRANRIRLFARLKLTRFPSHILVKVSERREITIADKDKIVVFVSYLFYFQRFLVLFCTYRQFP